MNSFPSFKNRPGLKETRNGDITIDKPFLPSSLPSLGKDSFIPKNGKSLGDDITETLTIIGRETIRIGANFIASVIGALFEGVFFGLEKNKAVSAFFSSLESPISQVIIGLMLGIWIL